MKKIIFLVQFTVVISASIFAVCAQQAEEKITNTLGMEFVLIPQGQFMMGSPKDETSWCQDQFGPYLPDEVTDPKGPAAGTYRVMRGGHATALPATAALQVASGVHRTIGFVISDSGSAGRLECTFWATI